MANRDRSIETGFKNYYRGKSSLNLPYWKSDAPNKSRIPDYSNLAVISPKKRIKGFKRLSRLYPGRYLKVPWIYVFRSRIANKFRGTG